MRRAPGESKVLWEVFLSFKASCEISQLVLGNAMIYDELVIIQGLCLKL